MTHSQDGKCDTFFAVSLDLSENDVKRDAGVGSTQCRTDEIRPGHGVRSCSLPWAARPGHYKQNAYYAFGGVPSSFPTTASIWTKASLSKADTPIILRAGTPPGKNVV